MNILGGFKHRPVFLDPEIELECAEIEHPAVINEGHEADDRDDEHQRIERQVHRAGKATRDPPYPRRQCWRRMAKTIPKPREEHQPEKNADQRVYVDPECLS